MHKNIRLKDTLNEYIKNNIYPFHMPGHKRNPRFIPAGLLDYDVTELEETDNLHNPTGVMLHTQQYAAGLFGAKETFFLVNGATAGILASFLATVSENEGILLARNSHKSAYSGLVLTGAKPYYLYPHQTDYGFAGGINPESVRLALEKHPGIKAVFITSPTYEGFVSSILEISAYCKQYGKVLIVDEAHGAHFPFHPYFPESALANGADIVIHSLHKTLPALGQTALLHINNMDLKHKLKQALDMLQTSSPSYILLQSIDRCMDFITSPDLFGNYVTLLQNFREKLNQLSNLRLMENRPYEKWHVVGSDPSKLVILTPPEIGYSKTLYKALKDKHGLALEMYGPHHVLAMTSMADTGESFIRLSDALLNEDKEYLNAPGNTQPVKMSYPVPEIVMTPKEAFRKQPVSLPLAHTEGSIAADYIIPYPPGIPLVAPGERINKKVLTCVSKCINCYTDIVGLDSNRRIQVMEE